MRTLFSGPSSLRHPRERLAFLAVLIWALPFAAVLGFFIHESIRLSQVALFIVIAMLYVTLARGRLIGSSVMIHETQYPRVFAIVKRACAALQIPMPLIFVREDYYVPIAALGFGEPYSLVLSSHFIEYFEDDELAFVIGRQLGHMAAGHTRFLSLLSVNGNENFLIALIFGPWLRTCELTCDKIGLLVCGSLDAAARGIAVSMFHHFGRQINVEQFAEQGREIANDSILRWGEWLGGEPYATRRIAEMRQFMQSAHYQAAEASFVQESIDEPPPLPAPGELHVTRADCSGWWRRATAVFIDLIVVSSLVAAFSGNDAILPFRLNREGTAQAVSTSHLTPTVNDPIVYQNALIFITKSEIALQPHGFLTRALHVIQRNIEYTAAAIYMALLVGFAGQTFGMMITGLRIVTPDFRRPGIARSLWRYAIAVALWPIVLVLSAFQHRIMLHDRWSGTRLITAERAMARASAAVTAMPS